MTPEQIVPLALFVIVVLFNLVGRWLRRRLEGEQVRPAPEAPAAPLPPRARMVTPPEPRRVLEEHRPPPRPSRVQRPRQPRRLLGTPTEVRRAIVLMAVLGPCRGVQPDGPDSAR